MVRTRYRAAVRRVLSGGKRGLKPTKRFLLCCDLDGECGFSSFSRGLLFMLLRSCLGSLRRIQHSELLTGQCVPHSSISF